MPKRVKQWMAGRSLKEMRILGVLLSLLMFFLITALIMTLSALNSLLELMVTLMGK